MEKSAAYINLELELAKVRTELDEANDVIEAIRSGEVDALVVNGKNGHQLFTLKSSDQTYRIFIEQMTESALTLDRSGLILYCNSQFAKLIDLPLEKTIGLKFADFIHEEDRDFVTEVILGAWDIYTRTEIRLQNRLHDPIIVQLSLKALNLDDGVALSVIITDLTAIKNSQRMLELRNKELEQARNMAHELNDNLEQTVKDRTSALELNIHAKTEIEQVLRENESRLTSILHTMGEGLCILDENGCVTFANRRAKELFALNDKEIVNRDYYSLQKDCFTLEGVLITKEQHPIALMIKEGEILYDQEILIHNANDIPIYISINASPLVRDGKATGTVMTFTDVTNRRKITLQKDDFISVASHEIKTPLTSLKASMQLLTKVMHTNPDSEKIPVLIQKANSNLAKVVHLADDLMNVSKIQHGPLPLNKQPTDIIELIESCGDQVLQEHQMDIVLHTDTYVEVNIDKQRIEQVLVNLFNNAVKYAPNSKVVKVLVAHKNEFLKVSIQDFGQGISADKLPHLFDRYYQIDPQGMQVSGLGLGLYISNEIIMRHGGELTVESTLGQGSTFSFTLPCTIAEY